MKPITNTQFPNLYSPQVLEAESSDAIFCASDEEYMIHVMPTEDDLVEVASNLNDSEYLAESIWHMSLSSMPLIILADKCKQGYNMLNDFADDQDFALADSMFKVISEGIEMMNDELEQRMIKIQSIVWGFIARKMCHNFHTAAKIIQWSVREYNLKQHLHCDKLDVRNAAFPLSVEVTQLINKI